MAHAYGCELAERDYSLASTQLELHESKRQVQVLEVKAAVVSDDLEEAKTANEVRAVQADISLSPCVESICVSVV